MDFLNAIILGVVEGITEFLPVSSTGHLILVGNLLGFTGDIADTFEIFIQLGAILAVVIMYRAKFIDLLSFRRSEGFSGARGVGFLIITSMPAMVIGLLAHSTIKDKLFNPFTVAIGLGVGAIWIILAEKLMAKRDIRNLDSMSWKSALGIGLFQCLALWPGMSRSSSTILGAMMIGFDRKAATEYSFFAAVPVLVLACVYDLLKNISLLNGSNIWLFLIGFVVSFASAWLAIRLLIRWISHHTLIPFGWYRLAVALVVFWMLS